METSAELNGNGGRAAKVLAAFRHFAHHGLVCQTTGTLAQWLGVSVDTVRRGIAELLGLGWIEETGLRRGKAVQYRLVESPQPSVESPHRAGQFGPPQESPPTEAPAARSDHRSGCTSCLDDGWVVVATRPSHNPNSPYEEMGRCPQWPQCSGAALRFPEPKGARGVNA
jgi:hypothetical protein